MKEIKDVQIKVRITPTEKEQIMKYCEKYSISVSNFLRMGIEKILSQEEKD